MGNDQMQIAMKELQESMVILARIEKKQGVIPSVGREKARSEKLQRRIEKNLAEITEKLNRLIGPH